MKKILIVGGGGREHALVWKLSSSPEVGTIYCAPGNAGISQQAVCVPIQVEDCEALASFAEQERIDLTLVGPEAPLTKGIVDLFNRRGLAICGPTAAAAELEGSKAFAKEFMKAHGIPTADYRIFSNAAEAKDFVRNHGAPVTIKADGLAAGKGVIIAMNVDDAVAAVDNIMIRKAFGDAGHRVVIEEFLQGEEASVLVFTDGTTILPLPAAQDHKAIYDGDRGPNTGGMGAYSPAPVITPELHDTIMQTILVPTVSGMAAEGRVYKGILYAGIMISGGKPVVLEFNVRMGDPEAQPLLMRMRSDLLPVLEAIVAKNLHTVTIEWDERPAVCVVLASEGYPDAYEKGKEISGLEQAAAV
ncbi:MAG TPA: phosphoribosylamine--glycine ligase, partial [Thermodesulfobacteriota bacterium]|nr:phosphoribosylamine--glycine ligase [Thermodesulfobacteriota bacterium]